MSRNLGYNIINKKPIKFTKNSKNVLQLNYEKGKGNRFFILGGLHFVCSGTRR